MGLEPFNILALSSLRANHPRPGRSGGWSQPRPNSAWVLLCGGGEGGLLTCVYFCFKHDSSKRTYLKTWMKGHELAWVYHFLIPNKGTEDPWLMIDLIGLVTFHAHHSNCKAFSHIFLFSGSFANGGEWFYSEIKARSSFFKFQVIQWMTY